MKGGGADGGDAVQVRPRWRPFEHIIEDHREGVHVDGSTVLFVAEHLRSHEAIRACLTRHHERRVLIGEAGGGGRADLGEPKI